MVTGRYPIRISFVLLLAFAACGGERSDQGGGRLAASEPTTVTRSNLVSNGGACTASSECTSGFCADGVCCNAACVGECVACNVSGSAGTCMPLANSTPCDDGNHCNTGDSCQAGTCLPGTTNVCNDPQEPKFVSVIELGSVQGSWQYATGINNNHVVVGIDTNRGFAWTATDGMFYVPGAETNTYAVSINDNGVMAAGKASGTWLPCRYNPAVDTQPVCQPSEGRTTGINAAGTVTGWTVTGYFNNAPVTSAIRLGAGSLQILDPVPYPGMALNAVGVGIDGDGTVVGRQAYYGAVRWRPGQAPEVLHNLLPSGSNNNFLYHATFIRSGEILGWAGWYDTGRQRAYRIKTNANGNVTAIDRLPMPAPYAQDAWNISSADASNASGKIVGTVYDPSMSSAEAAFVYSDVLGYSINLNDLVDPDSHWTLLSASGINDHDEVVGYGTHNGTWRAFKMTLPALSLPVSGNGDIMGFEDPARWTPSSGTTSSSQQHTQGNAALAIASPSNYTAIVSDALTSNGSELFGIAEPTSFLVDLFLPTQQPNPNSLGTLEMFITSVSRGVNNQSLGVQELTGAPVGAFSTWEFPLPSLVVQQLNGGPFSDLRVTIALNLPSQGTGTYVFDNLRLKGPVKPVLECVTALEDGKYRALFGYENSSANDYHQPVGPGNRTSPDPEDRGQPTSFSSGTHARAFSAEFTGSSLSWEIRGQVATATPSAPSCNVPRATITPIVECVRPLGNDQYEAIFGYQNDTGKEVEIPVSVENRFTQGFVFEQNRGQVTTFKTGRRENVFSVVFSVGGWSSNLLSWIVAGASATATPSSPACPPPPAVQPILEGIQHLDGNRFKAFFGYQNNTGATVEIPLGAYNKFTPGAPASAGQPTYFQTGRRLLAFAVESDGAPVTWQLAGVQQTATAQSAQLDEQLLYAGPTVPTKIDICHEILRRAFVPAEFGDIPDCKSPSLALCIATPDCCLPKPLCAANAICLTIRKVLEVAAYWREGVDLTCEFGNLEDELTKFVLGVAPLNVVVDPLLAYLEIVKEFADPIPGPVRAILEDLISEEISNGTQNTVGFTPLDIESALLLSKDSTLAAPIAVFTKPSNDGVTLDNLILLNDVDYNAILDSTGYVSPQDFRAGLGSGALHVAINKLVHELVHVRQYRNAGPNAFIDQYLAEIILHGYGGSALEDEAFSYESIVAMRH